uniref:Uncharacterized protein n=1 Tax=Arundo donax TaxID=35708 RepID=A0A0A9G9G5_ARUDO
MKQQDRKYFMEDLATSQTMPTKEHIRTEESNKRTQHNRIQSKINSYLETANPGIRHGV